MIDKNSKVDLAGLYSICICIAIHIQLIRNSLCYTWLCRVVMVCVTYRNVCNCIANSMYPIVLHLAYSFVLHLPCTQLCYTCFVLDCVTHSAGGRGPGGVLVVVTNVTQHNILKIHYKCIAIHTQYIADTLQHNGCKEKPHPEGWGKISIRF